jgi:hypothetical protein
LSDFNKTLNFQDRVFKNTKISIFIKIRIVGVELFHADRKLDRQAGMMKLIVAFRNFTNELKNKVLDICFPNLNQNIFIHAIKKIYQHNYYCLFLAANHLYL